MNDSRIVIGIDGSDAAINAAKWAVTEATSRDIALHLIHAIPEPQADAPPGDDSLDLEFAETALRAASAALHAIGQPVKIEADVMHGSPENVLINESRNSAMVCVGSVGTGWIARKLLGSTAEAVARKAHCPVAIIRPNHDAATSDPAWIAVVVDDSPGNDAVLEHGFREARLRAAPILALGVWRWGLGEISYKRLDAPAWPLGISVSRRARPTGCRATRTRRISSQHTGIRSTRGRGQRTRQQGGSNGRSNHSTLRAHRVFGTRGARLTLTQPGAKTHAGPGLRPL